MKTMSEKAGVTFSIAKDNPAIAHCTISKEVIGGPHAINYFSLGEDTDISAEIHPYHKFIIVNEGELEVYTNTGESWLLHTLDGLMTPSDIAIGMRTKTSAVYTEIQIRNEEIMNSVIKAGEVFKLADLLPYQEGRIVNMDIVNNDSMKFVVMSFDKGTGLSEHAAPGEAIIFALDGEAVITYEGVDHVIKAGENFHFARGGKHAVKATCQFKMGLLLTLE